MFRRLGVSIYPDHSDFDQDVAYLEKAKGHGFERVFMSMLLRDLQMVFCLALARKLESVHRKFMQEDRWD